MLTFIWIGALLLLLVGVLVMASGRTRARRAKAGPDVVVSQQSERGARGRMRSQGGDD